LEIKVYLVRHDYSFIGSQLKKWLKDIIYLSGDVIKVLLYARDGKIEAPDSGAFDWLSALNNNFPGHVHG